MTKSDIEEIARQWTKLQVTVEKQYHANTERCIYRLRFGGQSYLLKGISESKSEETIRGNVEAYRFLGNEKHISQKIFCTLDGRYYSKVSGYWFYLLEFIEGNHLCETVQDEEQLGVLARKLHSYHEYMIPSSLNEDKTRFYEWFSEREFKSEFDHILDGLPNFSSLERCFIHSDLGPHNAIKREDGEIFLIDLDDAGVGSRHLDIGWAFIMQFVDFNHQTEEMQYRFDLAKAFLKGYYGEREITAQEYNLIWAGAIYMHISYMQVYGSYAVDSLWKILKYGISQKEKLWQIL